MPQGFFVCPWTPYCSSLCAHVPLAVANPRLLLTEMLVGCSLRLSSIERSRRLRSWLPWRHLQTTAWPFMCHCHHPFGPSVWKNNFISIFVIHWQSEHCATVTGPEPPPKKMRCSIIFTLTRLSWSKPIKGERHMWPVNGWTSLYLTISHVFIYINNLNLDDCFK